MLTMMWVNLLGAVVNLALILCAKNWELNAWAVVVGVLAMWCCWIAMHKRAARNAKRIAQRLRHISHTS